eukprot:1057314-Rhodomonas_salina.1
MLRISDEDSEPSPSSGSTAVVWSRSTCSPAAISRGTYTEVYRGLLLRPPVHSLLHCPATNTTIAAKLVSTAAKNGGIVHNHKWRQTCAFGQELVDSDGFLLSDGVCPVVGLGGGGAALGPDMGHRGGGKGKKKGGERGGCLLYTSPSPRDRG